MSTLPGQASKGEKTKPKFQSLDINSLYTKVSRGENPEKQQQKSSSSYIKHGMQSLGKVPSARRPPANLPSLKSEHSGTDAAVPLVPPGAQGWGKQESTPTSVTTTSQQTPTTTTATSQNSTTIPSNQQALSPPQLSAHQAAIALPVTNPVPHTHKQLSAQTAQTDKLWSSVTSGYPDGAVGGAAHPPLYHSQQFQHEFPSLSSGDGGLTRTGIDALPYPTAAGGTSTGGPANLSLRPQTEGSWTQGGQRRNSGVGGDSSGGQARPGSVAHQGGPPQLPQQVGLQAQQQSFPPQIRGVMPPFMYKGSFPQGSGIGIQSQNTVAPTPGPPVNGRGTHRPMEGRPPRLIDREPGEEVVSRPIIKEEELNRMDEISKDAGWAESDEIDYSQKLAFSDDESDRPSKKEQMKRNQQSRDQKDERYDNHLDSHQRQWNIGRSSGARGRSSEDEDNWVQSQTKNQIEIAVQKAKQRKEDEEKRFDEERKQGSAKKLMELEEKIQKRDKDNQEGIGTISPNSVPPKPINPRDIPLPDFQKEKECEKENIRDKEHRSRTPNDHTDDRNRQQTHESSFRQLTQIEGKNIPTRKHPKTNDRDQRDRDRDMRDQNAPSFSRSFKDDLPPRFTRQQRTNSSMNLSNHQFERGWNQNVSKLQPANGQYNINIHNRNIRQSPDIERDRDEDDRREYKRQSSEDSYRSPYHSQDISQKPSESLRYEEHLIRNSSYESQSSRKDQEEDKRQKDKETRHTEKDIDDHSIGRVSSDEWNEKREKFRDEKSLEKHDKDRERPQRPDSRDSRPTRHSRDSEPRDYMDTWTESYTSYEEKRRDHHIREDRRVVPGPITKDRIEADDMRNEKRNLTQLKKGQSFEVKTDKRTDQIEVKKGDSFVSAWADAIPTPTDAESAKLADDKKTSETHKSESKNFNEQMKKPERSDDYSRNRPYLKKSWNEYHPRSQGWSKRSSSRSQRTVRGSYGTDHHHGTDSEGSAEEHTDQKSHIKSESQKIDQRSPKSIRKFDKDEKNRDKQEKNIGDQRKYDKTDRRDSYVPKGEPSRHGRGGSNFRSSRGGLGRRIEGYGPPPSKSPFGHHEEREREKKCNEHQQSESPPAPPEDKTKQNQQALAAGIAGKRSETMQFLDKGRSNVSNRSKPSRKCKDDFCDTNSENSDEKNKDYRKIDSRKQQPTRSSLNRQRNTQPPRMSADKRSYETPKMEISSRQNSNSSLKKEEVKANDQNLFIDALADINVKNKQSASELEDKEDKTSGNGDTEGFQEVKSKKTVKERQKPVDEKQIKPTAKVENNKEIVKNDRDRKPNKGNFSSQQLTQQQIQNIPSLMATPVNPPQVLPQPKSSSFHRDRLPNLAPRFAKQKLKAQLQHQQQQHQLHSIDINELNKPNQSIGMYSVKETAVPTQSVTTCAWDKPLGPQLRNMESDNMLGVNIDPAKSLDHRTHSNSQANSPNTEKILNKPVQLQDKSLLDGTTPPVNTIIFENTNYKSTPSNRNNRNEKPRSKLEEGNMENSVIAGFNKPSMNELLQNKSDNKADAIQLPLFKEDNSDMKLDFFGSDLQFTDDKKNLCISSKPIHAITSGNNTVDSLDIKIASVKKVWETSEQESEEITFGGPSLDSNVFTQGKDTPDDSHEGYSPSPNQTASTTTNVCKVKPTQQVSGNGQTALSSTSHQAHSGIVASGLIGSNPLSPPPIPPVLGANVSIGPQQFTANQHISYQASLSGNTQYGIPAIPSPPTVPLVYNSTQPLQAAAAQTPVPYGAFQIDGVLSGQGRNQFSQYPSYHSLGQTASSPYPTQSVYLQTAPPHPPAAQAPPELYPPNISNYRLSATNPFGQNQQLNNPTTVLISSTSNSLMSASVKPSNQQISAIGTKAGGVGQAYQQQSQQGQQVYMAYEPAIPTNYLTPNPSVMQRGPAGPVQNNVVQALQPSSSFYSGSTGAQTGYFQQPGSSTIPSAQLQQHQAASFSLPGNVFGTPNQSHTNTGLQNFNSHFLTTPMQVAAALNAQQYRSNLPAAAYIKGVKTQMSDQAGRAQQLKSPSSQEVLSSVFNTGPQIPSPKSRQNPKHPPPQSSPTTQHKYNLYPGMGGQQNQNVQRYPTPIQRPVNFQQMQGSNTMNQKHRNNPSSNKGLGRQYYGGQTSTLSVQNEKTDDSKINENVALSNTNSASSTNKTATISTSSANSVNTPSDKVKDNIKEESAALKE